MATKAMLVVAEAPSSGDARSGLCGEEGGLGVGAIRAFAFFWKRRQAEADC